MVKKQKVDFDKVINDALEELHTRSAISQDYAAIVKNIDTLTGAKEKYESSKKSRFIMENVSKSISIDKLLIAGVSVAEILMILAFENDGHFLHSKAMSLITKIKM